MKTHFCLLISSVMIVLSGCTETTTRALPSDIASQKDEIAIAEALALRCPSVGFDETAKLNQYADFIVILVGAGWTPPDIRAALGPRKSDGTISARTASIAAARQIDLATSQTACEAARREKAKGSQVGKLLV